MGYFVNVIAKESCEQQINALWNQAFGEGPLVMDEDLILQSITNLKANPQFSHLHWVNTVEEYEELFPIMARRRGQVFLAPAEGDEEGPEVVEPIERLQAKVRWLQTHRLLFEEIRNLQDAVDAIGLDYQFDGYEQGKEVIYDRPDFAKLPSEPNNKVFNRCLELNRPDIWARFLEFRENPCVHTWKELKSVVVPSDAIGGSTIWQYCEKLESQRTGQASTIYGVYGGSRIPPVTDVVRAILNRPDVHRTPKTGQRPCP